MGSCCSSDYGLKVIFVCLHITLSHYLHYLDLSESIEDIYIKWYKILVRYILSGVCLTLSPFSQLSFMWDIWICVFSACPILFLWKYVYFILISMSNAKLAWHQTPEWGPGSVHSWIEQLRLKCKNISIGTHFVTSSNIRILPGV